MIPKTVREKCTAATEFPLFTTLLSKSTHVPSEEKPRPLSFTCSCALLALHNVAQFYRPSRVLNPLLLLLPPSHSATCFSLRSFNLTSHSCDWQSTKLVGLALHFIAFLPPTCSLP